MSEVAWIGRILGPELGELPEISTICTRMQDLKMSLWRAFLRLSAQRHYTGEIQTIDATGMDWIAASHHDTNGRITRSKP
jgi:hypothetical protein